MARLGYLVKSTQRPFIREQIVHRRRKYLRAILSGERSVPVERVVEVARAEGVVRVTRRVSLSTKG